MINQDTPEIILSYFGNLAWLSTHYELIGAYCLLPDGHAPINWTTRAVYNGRYQHPAQKICYVSKYLIT